MKPEQTFTPEHVASPMDIAPYTQDQRKISRRTLLTLPAIAAGSVIFAKNVRAVTQNSPDIAPGSTETNEGYNSVLKIEVNNPRELTYEEQKNFARRLYRNIERMSEIGLRRGVHDADELYEITTKMEEYFPKVGITSQYGYASAPEIEFVEYEDPEMREHVAAQALCLSDMTVNARYTDPEDPWYDDPDLIYIMAHEMAHLNGVCAPGREYTESSAQLAAVTVLGAMANDSVEFRGRQIYLYAFTDLLRSMTMSSLLYRAKMEGREMDYFNFKAEVIPGLDPEEAYSSTNASWEGQEEEHLAVLDMYGNKPLRALMVGLVEGHIHPEDVFLPVNMDKVCAAEFMCSDITPEPDKSLNVTPVAGALETTEDRISHLEYLAGQPNEVTAARASSNILVHGAMGYQRLPY